ncbi:MAG: P-type DNA transfer ATPase VirB11 [Proteobacteria bacterium]|nr:P-type DNA transfer ATPase VirB11 [Pseudomonadota bacterium]
MTSPEASACSGAISSLDHFSRPLRVLLDDPSVTELCIQKPGEVYVERSGGWFRSPAPWVTCAWARHFARLVATATEQRVSPESPLLSAAMPTGERVQVVLPPATWRDRVVIAIRRPSRHVWSLDELGQNGIFDDCRAVGGGSGVPNSVLTSTFAAGDWRAFLAAAVRQRLNILVAGATGSGKTTLTKALIDEIPTEERLISIEDAAELAFPRHGNSVRLFYSKDDQGRSRVAPKQLLEASLRLRPDRILLAELRGEEAYYFLRNVSSGHPGSITSIHAGSAALAFEQLALLVKESAAGRELAISDIHRLMHAIVDVVVYCVREGPLRRVGEVWWRDGAARSDSVPVPMAVPSRACEERRNARC